MRRILVTFGVVLAVSSAAQAAPFADSYYHDVQPPTAVPQAESTPNRPLTLPGAKAQVGGGLYVDLSSDVAGDSLIVPVSAAYGLTPRLEVGLDTSWMMRPFVGNQLVAMLRMYGRYVLLRDLLALEVALHVPTVLANGTALEVIVPARWRLPRTELFGALTTIYRLGQGVDLTGEVGTSFSQFLSLAGTALVDITGGVVAVGDFGVSYTRTDLGEIVDAITNKGILLGLGAGYRISPSMFVKAGLVFSDLADRNPVDDSYTGLDRRAFQVTFVQMLDLSGGASSDVAADPSAEPIQ